VRPQLEVVNVGFTRIEDAELTKIRTAIEQHNPWDHMLYQEILRLFPYPSAS
jgi:hypothetical protein